MPPDEITTTPLPQPFVILERLAERDGRSDLEGATQIARSVPWFDMTARWLIGCFAMAAGGPSRPVAVKGFATLGQRRSRTIS